MPRQQRLPRARRAGLAWVRASFSVSLLITINAERGDPQQVTESANGQGKVPGHGSPGGHDGSGQGGAPPNGSTAGPGSDPAPDGAAPSGMPRGTSAMLRGTHYKWVALSNTTLGMLSATVNASIVIISLPAIFRGIKLNPLTPGNVSYLLWMLMGYLVVSAVLVVTLGRLGDIYGRVKMYNAGFTIFALGALALPFDPLTGPSGALWLIGFRVIQAVGGAMLMANAPAILTDAFPSNQRGTAMGINQVAGISGMFIGLILGGVLAAVDWRLVFIVSVPIGLVALLVGITYGLLPYGGHSMGWTSPLVLSGIFGGVAMLVVFCFVEQHVAAPMFDMQLMRIRAFAARLLIPTDFSYPVFAVLIFVAGAGMGLFSAPNAAGIMNSVPAKQRGAASGMLATFQNSGFVLSIGIFFTLMIAGLAATLPSTLTH